MESIHVCEFGLLTTQWYRYFPVNFGKYARKVEIYLYMHVSWFPLSCRRNSKSFLSRDTCTTPNMNPVLAIWAYILKIRSIRWTGVLRHYFFCCSFPLDGKDKAVDVGAIPELVLLLKDDNTDVRAQAAGAIMT